VNPEARSLLALAPLSPGPQTALAVSRHPDSSTMTRPLALESIRLRFRREAMTSFSSSFPRNSILNISWATALRIIRLAPVNETQEAGNLPDAIELLDSVHDIRISRGAAKGTEVGFLASDLHVKRVAHGSTCLKARRPSTGGVRPANVLRLDQRKLR